MGEISWCAFIRGWGHWGCTADDLDKLCLDLNVEVECLKLTVLMLYLEQKHVSLYQQRKSSELIVE